MVSMVIVFACRCDDQAVLVDHGVCYTEKRLVWAPSVSAHGTQNRHATYSIPLQRTWRELVYLDSMRLGVLSLL